MKRSFPLSLLLSFWLGASSALAQCTPFSANLTGVGDDLLSVWINGHLINSQPISFIYIDDAYNKPLRIPFDPSFLDPTGNNLIAVRDTNTKVDRVLAAWLVDFTCVGGAHFLLTDMDGGYRMYDDPYGAEPPNPQAGHEWYQPEWKDRARVFHQDPVPVDLDSGYASINLWDPYAGKWMQMLGRDRKGLEYSVTEVLYFRKTFTLDQLRQVHPKVIGSVPFPSPTPFPGRTYLIGSRSIPRATPTPLSPWAITPTPVLPIARATPTPLPGWKVPTLTPTGTVLRVIKNDSIWTITPTQTPGSRHRLYPTPTREGKASTVRAQGSPLPIAQTFTYYDPPANIYVTFRDGPGHYQVEMVDGQGNHLKTVFEGHISGETDKWLDWDGRNEDGKLMPIGNYFALFYKDGVLLLRMAVNRVPPEK